jgi:hypothetical protein
MKQSEIKFECFYCGGEVKYENDCPTCSTKLAWEDIILDYSDKYLDCYKVCVK